MRDLVRFNRKKGKWKRLFVPTYFCQEVVAALISTGIEVRTYEDGPEDVSPKFGAVHPAKGDAILVVNYFGLRRQVPLPEVDPTVLEIVEDHSHDPWSQWASESQADWCIASLRKTLPMPDGGVLWSPRNHSLPLQLTMTAQRASVSLKKLGGMILKRIYLQGGEVQKEQFRKLAVSAEAAFAEGDISGISDWSKALLGTFPVRQWRRWRRRNHEALRRSISGLGWARVLRNHEDQQVLPFSGVVVFDSRRLRDYVLRKLVDHDVYPAILWPLKKPLLPGVPRRHADFSQRMISLHCDMRYTPHDLEMIGSLIARLGDEFNGTRG